ncbi:Small_glutamine-rich tetratricopeptide repeat-containing protein [Hexamita inflata]|uniref:Small glutamine-rich tetratricopeptide repeat-containing protein n=1 Tax=Hexamita inflata TaxID=28002 RepID=A0AA86UBG9_9EUKA|nr:Small glutamine-rich tetratricopeptide repeat-containing protein [Hexamita inflata]
MQKTNELIISYLQYLNSANLVPDKDSLEVAITCLSDVFKVSPAASPELLNLVSSSVPQSVVSSSEYKDQGNAAMKSNDHARAVELYTLAIEQSLRLSEPAAQRAVYLANRAAALKPLNQLEQAIADLKQAVELDPTYQRAWLRLAQFHEDNNDKPAAYAIYKAQNDIQSNEVTKLGMSRTASAPIPGLDDLKNVDFNNINKEELLQKFPMLGEALNDPEIQQLLQKPSVQEKMKQIQANPMSALQLMGDPEFQPLFGAIMKNMGPMMQQMGGMGDIMGMFGKK